MTMGVPVACRALGGPLRHIDELLAEEALGRFWTPFVEADDDTACWSSRVELFDDPLCAAKSGAMRSPNHVSALCQRKPSAMSGSSIRLRFINTAALHQYGCASW
jgi:hypothetical protein